MTSLDPKHINVHWIKSLRGVMSLSFHKWKKLLHFRCLLALVYMLCSIKLSIPARFSVGPQMMLWLINVLGVSCLWFQALTSRQNQETPGQKECTTRLQSFSQLLEGASGEGTNCSFLHEGMRFIREAQRSYTGSISSQHKCRKLSLQPHTSSLTCLIMSSCYNMQSTYHSHVSGSCNTFHCISTSG